MIIFLILSLILYFLFILYRSKNYLFFIYSAIFFLYEFPAILLYLSDIDDFVSAQKLFLSRIDDQDYYYIFGVLFFYLSTLFAYFFYRINYKKLTLANKVKYYPSSFFYLSIIIFIFGLASIYAGASSVRILDYAGEGLPTTPLFSYGITLLPVSAIGAYFFFSKGKYNSFLTIIVLCLPLSYEIFLTSRRQWFAPAILVIILIYLYSKASLKDKSKALILSSVAGIILFSIQFGTRSNVADFYIEGGALYGVIAPQFGEFIAISSTSLFAWGDYAVGEKPPTYGFHLLYLILDAFPFFKLGSFIFPDYIDTLTSIRLEVAPTGGMSLFADALISFGYFGLLIFGIFTGLLLKIFHSHLLKYSDSNQSFSVPSMFYFSLISILLLKYRSGFGDIFQATIGFTFLYFFFYGMSYGLAKFSKTRDN